MKGASLIAPLGIRIPEELKEKIQSQAKENGRSTNAEIVQILENSLSHQPNAEESSLKGEVNHLRSIISLKEEVISLQENTISHMDSTIKTLNSHIRTLQEHVDFLKEKLNLQ